MTSKFVRTSLATVHFAALLHCSNEYLFELIACVGPSMEPSFNRVGDLVITDKFSYRFLTEPRKGDVVMCTAPHDPSKTVVKRILALANDEVYVKTSNKRTILNPDKYCYGGRRVQVPKGHVWLEGDNATNSTDSRCYGPVPAALIRGRVVWKVWPLSEFGTIRDRELDP